MSRAEMRPSHASVFGGRSHQEDRFLVERIAVETARISSCGWLFGVMDGHNGSGVADFAAATLREYFSHDLLATNGFIVKALRSTVARLNEETRHQDAGSTLSMVYVPDDEACAYVAVLGDSPVVIRDAEGKLYVGPEHNARSNEKELKGALARGARFDGGYLFDPKQEGYYGLQLTRALGDAPLDRILRREPEIARVKLGEGGWILVATDGLLDPSHTKSADRLKSLVLRIEIGEEAESLVMRCLGDNATAILWRWKESNSV